MPSQKRPQKVEDIADLYWRGRKCLEDGAWREAAAMFRRAVRAAPADAELRRLLGLALARQDRFDDAIKSFRNAIICEPDAARTHADLGVTLLKADRLVEAIAALEQALALDPKLEQARLCLGMALSRSGEPDRALAILEPAVLHSTDPEVHAARAWAMLAQGRVEDSIAALHRTLGLNPGHPVARTNLLFALQHKPGITPRELLAAHVESASRFANSPTPRPARRPRAGLPVIGLVSGDLRHHAVGRLTLRAFEAMAARGFTLKCFANQPEEDEFTQRYRAVSRAWHRVDTMQDDALQALIAHEGVDILFDLSGMTARHRLAMFARRAAPLQLTWAGYTGTTGVPAMDALVADEREVPIGEDDCYTERVVRLPDCYVCFEPAADAPAVGDLPSSHSDTVRFGCFQRAPKLNRRVLGLWARIAERLPESCFVLRYGCYVEAETQRVVRRMAADAGLSPERIVFEPGGPMLHMLQGYNGIDIALDTFPYSGGVTTLEALWMGVPVVCMRGGSFAGRHSASHLHAAGLRDLIADDEDAYVDIAVALARDTRHLADLRAGMRARLLASPLMDAPRFAANLSEALIALTGS